MAYTEVQEKGGNKYYYRAKSVRDGKKVKKFRKYLGANLSSRQLGEKEREVSHYFDTALNSMLSPSEIKALEEKKKSHSSYPRGTLENRYEWFVVQFTYDSNAIEGNTLSLRQTSAL